MILGNRGWIGLGIVASAALPLLAMPDGLIAQESQCGVNAGAPVWNGAILFTDALAADIASSGCRWVRINFRIDGNTTWTPTHLARYDTIIQNARNHNLNVLGIICYEAVYGSQAEWNQNYNTTGINPYTTAFAENAWVLINRFKGQVKRFEIWNEPDCWSVNPASNPLTPGCFYIWPKNYANILAETYKKCIAMGGADFFTVHGVSLVTAGLFAHDISESFSTSRSYMTSVYNQSGVWNAFQAAMGRRYAWDYFGYHFYLNQGSSVSTSELNSYFSDIRAMKTQFSDASPIMVTEFGWRSSAVGAQLQADNLRNTYDWFRTQPDVLRAFWYQWNDGDGDGNWGLVYSIGSPKPAYHAFAAQCGYEPPPVADFSATPQSGRAPLAVQFADLSSGGVTQRQWDFGDGASGTQAAPLHVYPSPGVYTVTLTATGPGGSDSEIKANYITVLRPRVPGDLDDDNDVDGADVAVFSRCMTGAGIVAVPEGCGGQATNIADLDGDGDADQDDFGIMQRCISGSYLPVDPACGT